MVVWAKAMPRSGHHLDEIAGAELKRQIPPHAQDDDFLVKVPPFEEILCRGRFRHPSRYRKTPSVSTVCTRTALTDFRFAVFFRDEITYILSAMQFKSI
jgi:hypothetical protein